MRSSSDQGGGQLLQELEALSQALYKSQSIPTAPSNNIPPRQEFDQLGHRRRVSEAAGRPPRSSAAPASSSSRHSISGVLPSQDQKLSFANDINPDAYQIENKEQPQDDDHQESVIDLTHRKKGGIWSWKPLRALAQIGQHRLHCEFKAHIHNIDKLPASMNGLRLQINLRHRDTGVQTMPVRVSSCAAEFEEVLHFRCSVYASKSKSSVKYMSKSFTLSIVAVDIEELDLGKHQLDLTRILPASSLPTPGSQDSSSSWNTSFKLSGKARGGTLWVTFSYQIMESGASSVGRTASGRFAQSPGIRGVGVGSRSFNSLPSSPHTGGNLPARGKQPAMDYGSPAMSEPGNEYGGMEQLDLDYDEPPLRDGGNSDLNLNSNLNSNLNPTTGLSSWKPPLPGKATTTSTSTRAIDVVEHRGRPLFEAAIAPRTPGRVEEEEQQQPVEKIEDEPVFSVVEHGVETSALDEQDRSVFEEQKDDEQEEGEEEQEEEEEEIPQEEELVQVNQDYVQDLKETYQDDEQVDDEQEAEEDDEQAADAEEEEQDEEDQQDDEPDEELDEEMVQQEGEQEEYKPEELPLEVKLGLEKYNWKQELEEDDLYDSMRNPGMASSEVGNYWNQQRQEEKQSPTPSPAGDLQAEYKFEYQDGGESGDEASSPSQLNVKDGDEQEDELVADEFLDMLTSAPAAALPPPDDNPRPIELQQEYSAQEIVPRFNDMLQKYEAEEEEQRSRSSEVLQKYEVSEGDEEPDSPRALLLKQFEQEAMLEGGFGLDAEEEEVAAQLSFGSPIVPAFNLDDDDEPPERLILQQPQRLSISSASSSPERLQQQQRLSISSESSSPERSMPQEQERLSVSSASSSPERLMLQQQHRQSISSGSSSPQQQQQKELIRVESDEWNSEEDKELAAIMDAAESELQKATQAMKSKARAKMLEDAEAEALLQEWGLDKNVFQEDDDQPRIPQEESKTISESSEIVLRQGLPPLAPGVGASVPTPDGGSLRSMDTSHFQSGKNDGKLVMHVSKPVVVPAEMGTSAIDVLRNLAAAGTETMTAEAMAAMPLDDITGKSVQQIALEGQTCYEENNRRYDAALVATNRYNALEDGGGALATSPQSSSALYLPQQRRPGAKPRKQQNGEFLQLDELAPVAMEKIEELAMQGLKIQCDMAEEDAPYVLDPVQNLPQLAGSSAGGGGKLLLESSESSDGMIAMSLSLDEWMRLDAGLDDDEAASDKSKTIMAAHRAAHSTTTDLVLNLSGDRPSPSSSSSSSSGFGKMGDTLTLAMLVQLRDPLRNFEPVGAPMMALVEAERVLIPPKPKLWKRVALKGNSEADYDDEEVVEQPAADDDPQPQFKITGVHMAGLNVQEDVKDTKKKNNQQQQMWGNQRQQQSGSRWLVANGMGKGVGNKHPLLKSSKGRQGESSLWSISSPVVESPSSKSLTRNPDVKFGKLAAAGGFRKR